MEEKEIHLGMYYIVSFNQDIVKVEDIDHTRQLCTLITLDNTYYSLLYTQLSPLIINKKLFSSLTANHPLKWESKLIGPKVIWLNFNNNSKITVNFQDNDLFNINEKENPVNGSILETEPQLHLLQTSIEDAQRVFYNSLYPQYSHDDIIPLSKWIDIDNILKIAFSNGKIKI